MVGLSKFNGKKILAFCIMLVSLINVLPNIVNAVNYEKTYHTDVYNINSSINDAYYLFGYEFSNNSTLGYLKSSSYDCYSGFQFDNITLPIGAIIENVYISLYSSDSIDGNNYYTTIKGVDMVGEYGFVSFADFINTDLFSSYVNWNMKDLEGNVWKNSTDIKIIFNEIINSAGWLNNTSVQFVFQSAQSSSGYRSFRTYDYDINQYAPKLYIKYYTQEEISTSNPPDSLEDLTYDYIELISTDNSTGYQLWEIQNTSSVSGFMFNKYWYNITTDTFTEITTTSTRGTYSNALQYSIKEFNGNYYALIKYYATSYHAKLFKSTDRGNTWNLFIDYSISSSAMDIGFDIDTWGAITMVWTTGSYGSAYFYVHNATTGAVIKSSTQIFTGSSNVLGVVYSGKDINNKGKTWVTISKNGVCQLFVHTSYTGSFSSVLTMHNYNPYGAVFNTGVFFEDSTGIEAYLFYGNYASDGSAHSINGMWVHTDYSTSAEDSWGTAKGYGNVISSCYNSHTNKIALVYLTTGKIAYLKERIATPSGTLGTAHIFGNYSLIAENVYPLSIDFKTEFTNGNKYTIIVTQTSSTTLRAYSMDDSTYSPSLIKSITAPISSNSDNTFILNTIYNDTTKTSYVVTDENGDIVWEGEDLPSWFYNPPELISIELNNKGNGTYWMFKGEVYNITAIFNNAQIAEFNFTDGVHTILFIYNNFTKLQKTYVYNATGTLINENVINGITYSNNINGTIITTSWKFILSSNIVDILETPMNYKLDFCNSTTENILYTKIGISNLSFNIYNLGGFVTYSFVGDGGHTIGGSPFELYATNSSLVNGTESYSEIIYRRLQLIHMLVELNTDDKVESGTEHLEPLSNIGYYEFGIDYKIDGNEYEDWIEGWKCRIYISEINVGTFGASSDNAYVRMIVLWYNHGDLIRGDEYIYSFHNGYDKTRFPSDRQSITFWIDMWFDRTNSSTVLGGRVNAEYYGYFEDGVSYWFGYGGFRPMTGNITSSMLFDNILDDEGNIISSKQIGLVRAWERIKKTASAGDNNTYIIKPFQIFEIQHAQDRMEGINTPTFIEPKQLNLAGYSMLDPLLSILGGMGTVISNAIFGVGKMVISGIDTVLSWVGLPYGTFSTFVNMVMTIFNELISSFATTISMISKGIELMLTFLTTIVTFVDYIISGILFFGVDIFSIPIQFISLIMAVLNGGTVTFYGIYLDFTPYASLMIGLKTILPLFSSIMLTIWIFWGNFTMNGEPDVIGAVGRIFKLFAYAQEIFTTVFWIFNRIRNELISIYNFLRSHIPFLGGGSGGTVEE